MAKVVRLLGAHGILVHARPDGEMDYAHLAEQLHRRRRFPAIVVATAGTTMTEAVDDTSRIRAVLDEHHAGGQLHVDAALSGIPLALDGRLSLDDASGIGSVAISGHKFFGTPTPCGIVLIRDHLRAAGPRVAYTATADTTITGSRCGLSAALLWHAIAVHGREGHRWRASEARRLAAYTVERLNAVGWPAWRHPHAFTVVLPTPPEHVRRSGSWPPTATPATSSACPASPPARSTPSSPTSPPPARESGRSRDRDRRRHLPPAPTRADHTSTSHPTDERQPS